MRKAMNNLIGKLIKRKKLMVVIFIIVVAVICASIMFITTNKNKIDNRLYGYYASSDIVFGILPKGTCSVNTIIDKTKSEGSSCSWKYNGLFDKNFDLSNNGTFASISITLNQDGKTMELTVVYTEDYSSFVDTTNDRMALYKKIQEYSEDDTKKIKNINGSATAFMSEKIDDHATMQIYHTINFYDDMTCVVENFKQEESANNSNLAPSNQNTKWKYVENINYGECHYEISYPYYQLTVYTSEINESEEKELIFSFFVEFDQNSRVVSLNRLISEQNIKYKFIYKDGKDFGEYEKEWRILQKQNEEKIKKQYIGTWSNAAVELEIKEDGYCYLDYASSCTWKPISGNGYIEVTYINRYGESNVNYYSISDDLSEIDLLGTPTILHRN